MLLTAITGGIGSGKTTVSGALAGRGAPVVDADKIAREVVEPGGVAYAALRERFGDGVFDGEGNLDRAGLAAIVFSDPEALAELNAITHPAIGTVVVERIVALAEHDGPVVLDVPLLDERTIGLYEPQVLLVVDTPTEIAVARLVSSRGFREDDARARIAAQATREERRALIDLVPHGRVVDNSGDAAALEEEVGRVWQWLTSLPERPAT